MREPPGPATLVRNDILEDCGYTIEDFDGIDLGDPDKSRKALTS